MADLFHRVFGFGFDWHAIHDGAQEFELWSTIAVNGWALVTGGLLAYRYYTKRTIDQDAITKAAFNGLYSVGAAFPFVLLFSIVWGIVNVGFAWLFGRL